MRRAANVVPGLTLLLAVIANSAPGQAPDSVPPRVSATGQVTVRLVPTRAVIYLLVEATAPTSAEAMARGALSSASVIDTLRRIGGAEDVSLVEYGVTPTATYGSPGAGPPNTFTSRAAVRFTTSLANVQALTAAAYARGASGSAPPQFQHEELNAAIARALEEASAMARTRAEAVARGLGGRLGALAGISAGYYGGENSGPPGFPPPQSYDYQSRPLPEVRHSVQVTGTWVFVPR